MRNKIGQKKGIKIEIRLRKCIVGGGLVWREVESGDPYPTDSVFFIPLFLPPPLFSSPLLHYRNLPFNFSKNTDRAHTAEGSEFLTRNDDSSFFPFL